MVDQALHYVLGRLEDKSLSDEQRTFYQEFADRLILQMVSND